MLKTALGLWVALVALAMTMSATAQADTSADWLSFKGELTQGGLVRGQVAAGATLQLNGRNVPVDENGRFALGFGRDEPLHQVLSMSLPDGRKQSTVWMLKARHYDIQKITGIPEKIMNPDPAELERINREAAESAAARDILSAQNDYQSVFIWPAQGPISGVYGSQRFYNGEPRRPHFGLDIAAPRGSMVIAPAGGTVTLAHPDMFFSGGTVILDHGAGISSTFIHMDEVLVKEGQRLEQGDRIGKVGASGRATGPHLDWRMNWFDVRLDPQLVMQGVPMPALHK